MSPGSRLSICLSAQSSLSAAICSDMHAHHLLQASGTGDQFHRFCHTDCTAAWLAYITACTMSPGSHLSICLSAQSSLSAAMCSDMHAHHLLQASGTGDQFHRFCHTDCTAAWLAHITACTMSPGSRLSICLSAQSSLSAAICSDMHAHHLLQASGTGDQFHRFCHTDCTAAWLAHITACTMSPGSRLSICLSAQSSLSAAMCSDMHAHHLLQASGTGDQFTDCAILTALLHGWHTSLHAQCHQGHISASASVRKAPCQRQCAQTCMHIICFKLLALGISFTDCAILTALLHGWHTSLHAQCHQGHISASASVRKAACQWQCAQTCMHIICFKLVALGISFTDGAILTALLHGGHTSLHAQCHQAHISVSASMRKAACQRQCAQTCMHIICFKLVALGISFTDCAILTALLHGWHTSLHAQCHQGHISASASVRKAPCQRQCAQTCMHIICFKLLALGISFTDCAILTALLHGWHTSLHAQCHQGHISASASVRKAPCQRQCAQTCMHIICFKLVALGISFTDGAILTALLHGWHTSLHAQCHQAHISVSASVRKAACQPQCAQTCMHIICFKLVALGISFTDCAILTGLLHGWHTSLHAQCHQGHISASASVRKAACQRQCAQTCMHIICFKLVALGISFTDGAILTALLHGWHTSLHAQRHQAHISVSASVRKAACQRQCAQTCMHIICFKLVALGISFTDCAILTALLHGWHTSLHAQCHQAHISVSASVRKAACQRQYAQTCMHIICFKLVALGISFTDCAILTALLHGWHTSLHAQCHQAHISVSASVRKAACQRQCAQTCMHIICFKLVALGISFTDGAILTALLHGWHTSLHAQCHQGHISVSASVRKAACQRQCAQTCMHIICFKLVALGISFTDGAILTALLHGWHTSLHAQCHQGHISASASVRKAACQWQCAQTCMHIICFKLVALGISFTDCAILTALLHGWHTSLHAQCHQAHISVSASVRKAACQRQCAQTCMHIIGFKLVALGISFTDCAILTALLHGWHTSLHAQCHQAHISVSASVRKAACQRQYAQTCMHIICFKLVALGISFTDCAILTALLHGWHTSLHAQCHQAHISVSASVRKAACQRQCAQTCMHIICFKLVALGISFTDGAILTALLHGWHTSLHAQCHQGHISASASVRKAACQWQCAQTCMHIICFKLVALGISFTDCAILTALLHGWPTSTACTMSPGSRLSICLSAQSSLSAAICSDMHAHHLLQASGTGDQFHRFCHTDCTAAWLAHITACTMSPGSRLSICLSAQSSLSAAICSDMHAHHLLQASGTGDQFHRLCHTDCTAAWLAHITACTMSSGSHLSICLSAQSSLSAAICSDMHAHHLLQASGTGDQFHRLCHTDCTAAWLAYITACTCHQAHISVSASVRKAACQRQCAQTCMHIICFKLVALGISFTDGAILTALLHGWHTSMHAQCHQGHISASASVRKAACQWQCAQTCMHIICFKLVALGISFTDCAILTALLHGWHTSLHAQCHQAHISVSASVRKAACQRQCAQTCMHIICFKLVALGISFTDCAILTALLHGWHTSLHAQCHQAHISVSASVRKAACQRQCAQTCMHIICFKLVALGISFTDGAILTALLHGWHTSLHAQCHQGHISASASVRKAACQWQCAQTCMHIICFKLVALGISFTDCAILTALLHGWQTSLHAQCHQAHISVSASVRKAACQRQCAQTCMHIICFKLVALGISFTDCAILTALLHGWHTSLHAQCHQAHISVSASVRKAACQRQCAQTCMHIICFKLVALGISFTDCATLTALLHGWHTSLHAHVIRVTSQHLPQCAKQLVSGNMLRHACTSFASS